MSHYRRSDDYDYDDAPRNRWDRDRFEQVREERREIRPARQEVLLEERVPRTRYAEDRVVTPPRFASRVRHEIYEDYPREDYARALQPYKRDREREIERDYVYDMERRREYDAPPARPGLLRRQSSLDTFDRNPPARYRREARGSLEPVRARSPARSAYREEEIITTPRRREEAPRTQEVTDVEIYREREVRTRGRAKSDIRSVHSDARSSAARSSHHSVSSSSRTSSPSPVRNKIGKKGHTRLPMGQFKKGAIERMGLEYTEDGDFFRINRALDKSTIDQILAMSREMREPKVTTYQFDGDRLGPPRDTEHVETLRTEWINPPSVRGAPSVRAPSPARSHRTVRAASPIREEVTFIQQQSPVPPPVIIQQQPQVVTAPFAPTAPMPMTVATTTRTTERSHADIEAEIRRLEREKEIVRLERGGEVIYTDTHHHQGHHHHGHHHHNQVVIQEPYNEYAVVQYYVERDRGVRIEKDKKGRLALVRGSR